MTQAATDASSASQSLSRSIRVSQPSVSNSGASQALSSRPTARLIQGATSTSNASQSIGVQLVAKMVQGAASPSDATQAFRMSIRLSLAPFSISDSRTDLSYPPARAIFPPGFSRMPYYNGSGRESIYAYLQSLLQQNLQLTSLRRGYPIWNQMSPGDSPIGFMHITGGSTRNQIGLPPIYRDQVTVWVGKAQPSIDPQTLDQTDLFDLRDILEQSFLPDMADHHTSTLQGRAISCWVTQDFYQEAQSVGAWTSFVARLEVQYISAFNR
jgi:hypothetical protein